MPDIFANHSLSFAKEFLRLVLAIIFDISLNCERKAPKPFVGNSGEREKERKKDVKRVAVSSSPVCNNINISSFPDSADNASSHCNADEDDARFSEQQRRTFF